MKNKVVDWQNKVADYKNKAVDWQNKVADSIALMREILRERLTTLSEKFPAFLSLKAQQLRKRHLPGF